MCNAITIKNKHKPSIIIGVRDVPMGDVAFWLTHFVFGDSRASSATLCNNLKRLERPENLRAY